MSMPSSRNLDTWYSLREFETRDITARAYKSRHSLDLPAGKAREIASHVVQAREYFRNAASADFTVRPLLLYYGVASLARGITLFLDPKARESDLKPSHGLQTCDWGKDLSQGLNGIDILRVRLTAGLFLEFLTATENKSYFRSNSSGINFSTGGGIPLKNSEVSLLETVGRIPDIASQYHAWRGQVTPSVVLDALEVDGTNGTYTFRVSRASEEDIKAIFPPSMFLGRTVEINGRNATVVTNQDVVPYFAQEIGSLNIGTIVLFKPLEGGLSLTPLSSCFVLSFCLGMLCRYFPTTWINVARTEKGDAFYPLAVRLLDWIEETFPAMVVDVLRGPYEFEKS